MRRLAGELAELHDQLRATGEVPNEKISLLLREWARGGLPAVRELAKKGLAPAISVAIFARMAERDDRSPQRAADDAA